ncbi:MAG: 3-oxoacyl-ACP reductase FabG [Verrucomicrobiales bacterium]|nr:3-oxoacyl-ACP reductase FabG [Verrucomicrobiales bacterium]
MSEVKRELEGRVALVTGSSTGLGRAMALALASAGARVALNYHHNEARARRALAELSEAGHQAELFRADVTSEAEITRLVAEVTQKLGPVDILVLNATCDQPMKPVEEYEWAFVQRMLDFFVKSPFLLTQACVGHMKRQGWGRIINIGSEVLARGVPNFSAYVAAKGGQNGLHRSLATELAPFGITVNMVAPGWVLVERHAQVTEAEKAEYFEQLPAARWGRAEDMGEAVAFLASDRAAFITGQTLHVNGGNTVC